MLLHSVLVRRRQLASDTRRIWPACVGVIDHYKERSLSPNCSLSATKWWRRNLALSSPKLLPPVSSPFSSFPISTLTFLFLYPRSLCIMFLPCPSRLLSVPSSVPCYTDRYVFRFARIQNGFRWNSREAIITTNRLNDNILGETGIRTGARYDRICQSTSIGVAAMSNKCRMGRPANDFTE